MTYGRIVALSLAALVVAVCPQRPVLADDEPPTKGKKRFADEPAVTGRNDMLKAALKPVSAKASRSVVKVGGKAFGVGLGGRLVVTVSAGLKTGAVKVSGPAGSGEAKVLGRDAATGVALLEAPFDLEAIPAADDLTIGRLLACVGIDELPVAAGVLSAKNRKVEPRDLSQGNVLMGLMSDGIDGPKRAYPKVLQHDAPISDDALGSAVVDGAGHLLGVNVGTGYRGSSYAIATQDLLAVVAAIQESVKAGKADAESGEPNKGDAPKADKPKADKAKGDKPKKSGRPWIGASLQEKAGSGIVVDEVAPDSPALKAGVLAGDRLVALAGRPVKAFDDVAKALEGKKPGDSIVLEVEREGKVLDLDLTLGSR